MHWAFSPTFSPIVCQRTPCNGVYPPSISRSQKLFDYNPSTKTKGWCSKSTMKWPWVGYIRHGTLSLSKRFIRHVILKERIHVMDHNHKLKSHTSSYNTMKYKGCNDKLVLRPSSFPAFVEHVTKKIILPTMWPLNSTTTCFQIQVKEHHWRILSISYGVAIGACSSCGACGTTQLPNRIG